MNQIIINNKIFRQCNINPTYYVSNDGEVYSSYANKIIKSLTRYCGGKPYLYVDIWIDGRQRHYPIHKLVYNEWVGPLDNTLQVNHIDDNSANNYYKNLYQGTQQQNIHDCIKNEHRVGHVYSLTVYDKEKGCTLTFCPANEFIAYSGHSNKSGSLNKFFSKNWFKKRFEIIEFKRVNNLNEFKSVTTMGDECNPVD